MTLTCGVCVHLSHHESKYIVTLMVFIEIFFTSPKFFVAVTVRINKIQNYSAKLLWKLLNFYSQCLYFSCPGSSKKFSGHDLPSLLLPHSRSHWAGFQKSYLNTAYFFWCICVHACVRACVHACVCMCTWCVHALGTIHLHLLISSSMLGTLPACVSVHHMRAVPREARRRCLIPWKYSYGHLCATTWGLGIEPGSPEEQLMLLTTEPSLFPAAYFERWNFFGPLLCQNILRSYGKI